MFATKNHVNLQICLPLFQLSLQLNIISKANHTVFIRFSTVTNLIVKGGDYNCNHTEKNSGYSKRHLEK